MRIIETTSAPCLVCGTGNTPNRDGETPRFVDLERDINWNDPAILCEDCIMKIGGLIGMLSTDTLRDLQTQLRVRDERIHDLEAEKQSMERRAKRLGIAFTDESEKVPA